MTKDDTPSDTDTGSRERGDSETRKLNAFLDSIIDNIPAMVFVKDAEHLRYELFQFLQIDRKPLEAAFTGLYAKVLTDSNSKHLVEAIQRDR